jgi:uroporphyrinogen-III synthase
VIPLIIIRPEPGASETTERARDLGLDPHIHPLFALRAFQWTPPDPAAFDAVLVTSTNAVRFGGSGLACYHAMSLLAVGDASAVAAREAGFKNVAAGMGDGAALIALAAAAGYTRVLHLVGREHKQLSHEGVTVSTQIVYSADELAPEAALINALSAPCVVLVHSPRAASLLARIVQKRNQIGIVAISGAAAQAVGDGWSEILASTTPTDAAMLALAARLCKHSHQDV